MVYDIKLLHELCHELGFQSRICSDELNEVLEIEFSKSCVLIFRNTENYIGFKVSEDSWSVNWHFHDEIIDFCDKRGHIIEMNYLDLVTGLKDGIILICEIWVDGKLDDIKLIHHEYNDFLEYIRENEEIRVYRPKLSRIKK